MEKYRLLVAGIPESNPRVCNLFADCQVTVVTTLGEAVAALSQAHDAVIVAVRFNESRMFDLLRYLKSDGRWARLPVICYRSLPGPVTATPLAYHAIELASRSLGAHDFVDLAGDSDRARADRLLREVVFGAISACHQARPLPPRNIDGWENLDA